MYHFKVYLIIPNLSPFVQNKHSICIQKYRGRIGPVPNKFNPIFLFLFFFTFTLQALVHYDTILKSITNICYVDN